MKIKYKYWRIDGSCVVGGDNVALHYFPILLDPLLPRSCCLSFFPSVRVSQQRVSKYNFSNLSPFSPCRGRETRFTLERKGGHTFGIRLSTFFFTKEARPFRRLSAWTEFEYIFIHYFITKREEGEGRVRWMLEASSVFPLQRDL